MNKMNKPSLTSLVHLEFEVRKLIFSEINTDLVKQFIEKTDRETEKA